MNSGFPSAASENEVPLTSGADAVVEGDAVVKGASDRPRLLAVGDIHGCAATLDALMAVVQPRAQDTLVVLGDFVNRGPASKQVVDRLIELRKQTRLVTILGNHEEEMLAARWDPQALRRWLAMGGEATLASYGLGTTLAEIPESHWHFIEQALPWWEVENFFFTHANYAPDLPLAEQSGLALRWLGLHEQPARPHCSGKIAIVGHTANLSGHVVDYGFLRCLDTGCGLGGRLTAMDVRTRQIWQCPEV